MTANTSAQSKTRALSSGQQLFLRYTFAVLIDLTILNLFNEYWDLVFIERFSISLFAAFILQFLLQMTMALEHRVSSYFKSKPGLRPKIVRGFSIWAILFGSKLIILEILDLAFGSSLVFSGPFQGIAAFIVVVVAIIIVEQLVIKIFRSLA